MNIVEFLLSSLGEMKKDFFPFLHLRDMRLPKKKDIFMIRWYSHAKSSFVFKLNMERNWGWERNVYIKYFNENTFFMMNIFCSYLKEKNLFIFLRKAAFQCNRTCLNLNLRIQKQVYYKTIFNLVVSIKQISRAFFRKLFINFFVSVQDKQKKTLNKK